MPTQGPAEDVSLDVAKSSLIPKPASDKTGSKRSKGKNIYNQMPHRFGLFSPVLQNFVTYVYKHTRSPSSFVIITQFPS